MPTQIFANALISAAAYTLVGVSFGLIYNTARFFHFSHGAVYTIGAYTAFSVASAGYHWTAAVAAAMIVCGILGWFLYCGVYQQLQRRGVRETGLLVASLGLFVVLQNLVSIIYGDEMHAMPSTGAQKTFEFFGAQFASIQLINIIVSAVICMMLWSLVRFTRLGLALRAVAGDTELCSVLGLSISRILGWSFAIGSAIVGAAGALFAFDTNLFPTMGFNIMLMAVTAAVVGGLGSMPGTALAALLIAIAQQIAGWYFSAKWEDAVAFLVLLVFLVWRPQGFLGKPVQKAAV